MCGVRCPPLAGSGFVSHRDIATSASLVLVSATGVNPSPAHPATARATAPSSHLHRDHKKQSGLCDLQEPPSPVWLLVRMAQISQCYPPTLSRMNSAGTFYGLCICFGLPTVCRSPAPYLRLLSHQKRTREENACMTVARPRVGLVRCSSLASVSSNFTRCRRECIDCLVGSTVTASATAYTCSDCPWTLSEKNPFRRLLMADILSHAGAVDGRPALKRVILKSSIWLPRPSLVLGLARPSQSYSASVESHSFPRTHYFC